MNLAGRKQTPLSRQSQTSDRRNSILKFCVEIGEVEKHVIEFNFNQLLGQFSVKINRRKVKRNTWLLNEPGREVSTFEVGREERLSVRIEKERNRCWVNERLFHYHEGV